MAARILAPKRLTLLAYSIFFNYFQLAYLLRDYAYMPSDEILTVKELAIYLRIAEKTAYRFVAEGKIPAFKVGSAWRFKKGEIDDWIKRQSKSKTVKKGKNK